MVISSLGYIRSGNNIPAAGPVEVAWARGLCARADIYPK